MPLLPPELLREIIGHLSPKVDNGTLRAASLTAGLFRSPCQQALFAEVVVEHIYTSPGHHSRCKALLEALASSPHLLSYIKSVLVRNQSFLSFLRQNHKEPPLDKSVSSLLRVLSQQKLELVSIYGWRGGSTPEFQDAMLSLVGCPSLTTLELDFLQIDFVRAIGSSQIVRMALVSMYGGPWGPFFVTEDIPRKAPVDVLTVNLKHLSVTEDEEEVGAVLDPSNRIFLGRLQDLCILPTPEPFPAGGDIASLLSACALSLTRLHLDASEFEGPIPTTKGA
jgi:hypothetical protein